MHLNKRRKIKGLPNDIIEKIIQNFKFKTPKSLPPICSLISGYFSYDTIRYVERIPNSCINDLNIPDVRLMRPRTLIIHDNLKKRIYFIINVFKDEKIKNYQKKYSNIKRELLLLDELSTKTKINYISVKNNTKLKINSNTNKISFITSSLIKDFP